MASTASAGRAQAGARATAAPAAPGMAVRPFAEPAGGVREMARGPEFSFGRLRLQPKLEVGEPGDALEQEADAVADRVMRMPDPGAAIHSAEGAGGVLQRKCAKCDEEGTLRRQTAGSPVREVAAPPIVHQVLRSPGQPLDTATRAFMEPRIGHDFRDVRVHSDPRANASAQAVGALAYTVGRDVVLGQGAASPATIEGRRLMAHELAHVVQQSGDPGRAERRLQRQPLPPGTQLQSPRFSPSAKLERCFEDKDRLGEGDPDTDAVGRIQQALLDVTAITGSSYDLGPTGADGVYGPKTAAAIRKFKADEGLGSTQFGDVGPGTMRRLDQLFGGGASLPPIVIGLTVVNQAGAGAFPEPGPGGDPHFVTVAGPTRDESVIVEATTNRPLNPGETITWTLDPAASVTADPANPLRALVSRRSATRGRVTASSGGRTRSLTVWAIFAQIQSVAPRAVTISPPAAVPANTILPSTGCGSPAGVCVVVSASFDAEIFPKSLVDPLVGPFFAGTPTPLTGSNACGPLAGGATSRFDMSRQKAVTRTVPAGIPTAGFCDSDPTSFPSDDTVGNDDRFNDDEMDDPWLGGAIPTDGRAVPAGFMGSDDVPSLFIPHGAGAIGDTIQVAFQFREFARVDFNSTWWLLSNVVPWTATLRVIKNPAGLWVDNSTAGT